MIKKKEPKYKHKWSHTTHTRYNLQQEIERMKNHKQNRQNLTKTQQHKHTNPNQNKSQEKRDYSCENLIEMFLEREMWEVCEKMKILGCGGRFCREGHKGVRKKNIWKIKRFSFSKIDFVPSRNLAMSRLGHDLAVKSLDQN